LLASFGCILFASVSVCSLLKKQKNQACKTSI
jgi:hypothetical protein